MTTNTHAERLADATLNIEQCPGAIIANVEEIPGWRESVQLVTIRAHAHVLEQDGATLLAELAQARAEVGRLEGVIEKMTGVRPNWRPELNE